MTGFAGTVATLTTNAATTITGVIGGAVAASLVKQGSATLTLAGTNTFTGGTLIDQGIVIAQQSQAVGNGGNVIVANGATLASAADHGNGTVDIAQSLTVLGSGAVGHYRRDRDAGRRHRHQHAVGHRGVDRRHDDRRGHRPVDASTQGASAAAPA